MAALRGPALQGRLLPLLMKRNLFANRGMRQPLGSLNHCRRGGRISLGGILADLQSAFPIFNTRFGRMASSSVFATDHLEICRIPCLDTNYVWLLKELTSGLTAIVDAAEVNPIVRALEERGEKLDYILNTHHHWDHTGGNIELKNRYGCSIIGPAADKDRIPGIDVSLKDGDVWKFGNLDMVVFDTPGHTRGHITLYFPQASCLFPGDTIFAMGCGRLFEGTPHQMWNSLSKLMVLPPETQVFPAHEYTQANAKFAVVVDPDNAQLVARKQKVDELRAKGIPTLPCSLQEELDTNPFFRAPNPEIRSRMGVSMNASDEEAFAAVRLAKDQF